jgi:hypothetical protein
VTGRRWLLVAVLVLAIVQCVLWLVSAVVMWSIRNLALPQTSLQGGYNARFALALLAVGVINVFAVIFYMRRRTGRTGKLLAAVQAGNILVSLWASIDRNNNFGWLLIDGVPAAVTLLLLYGLRRAETAPSA